MNAFDTCLYFSLHWEGGDSDNPKDPGGATRQGITQKTYDRYRDKIGKHRQSVFLMTEDERDAIYMVEYWTPIRGDDLPLPVALLAFDGAINQGVKRASLALQKSSGADADGVVGGKTVIAVAKEYAKNPHAYITSLAQIRSQQYLNLDNDVEETFERGWHNRLIDAVVTATRLI